jgi:hypothetical protein
VNQDDIMRQVNALPDRFADRLAVSGLDDVRDAARAGEWGEAVDILLAGLIKGHVTVTADEQDELRSLLTAMGMATEPIDRLSVGST